MKQIKSTYLLLLLAVFSLVSGPTAIGFSQDNDFGFGQTQEPGKQDPLADPLQDPLKNPLAGFGSQNSEPRADFESKFVVQNGKNKGMLLITGKPDFLSHSHIYSQRTDLEHHKPTIFTVIESADFKVGKFVPDIQPENVKKDVNGVIWANVYQSNYIYRIDAETGAATGRLDLSALPLSLNVTTQRSQKLFFFLPHPIITFTNLSREEEEA